MKLRLLTFALLLGITFKAQSQEIELKNMEDSLRVGWWDRSTQLAINFAQASFNDSWQGGGVNNVALGFLFNNKADFTKGKGKWSNDFRFQYGFLNNKGVGLRKSVDQLFIDSKYSRTISNKLSWFAGANFISQFAGGFQFNEDNTRGNMISNIFAPGYLSEGIGLDYTPTKHFKLSLGGATLRQTFQLNDEVFTNTVNAEGRSYGVERGKRVLTEMGLQAVAAYNKDILPNVNLSWRYQAFFAYAPETRPIDHNINLILAAKVNKYLNVNFSLIGIYDSDAVDKLQLSQGLAAGLSFNL